MRAIKVGKSKVFLGYYDSEDEEGAARMFDRGQIAYLGHKEADQRGRTNFPVQQDSHELDWLERLGVVYFAERLKAARKQLKAADEQVTPEATLEVAKAGQGEPSSPGPQQHGASDNAADEEIKIRKLACKGPPPRGGPGEPPETQPPRAAGHPGGEAAEAGGGPGGGDGNR